MRKSFMFLLAAALCACFPVRPAAGAEQNSYRAPVRPPAPMGAKAKPRKKSAIPAGRPHPTFFNRPAPMQRRDREMGTEGSGIFIGRDPKTGDDVMSYTPPEKKEREEPQIPVIIPVLKHR